MIDGGTRSADAEALEDCELLFVPLAMVQDICARVPAAAQALTASLAATLRRLTDVAADLVFLDPAAPGGQDRAQPAARRRRRDPAEDEPGGTRAPGRRHEAKRERGPARLRKTRLARVP
jgi:CRP-like cAMP-binding protein